MIGPRRNMYGVRLRIRPQSANVPYARYRTSDPYLQTERQADDEERECRGLCGSHVEPER